MILRLVMGWTLGEILWGISRRLVAPAIIAAAIFGHPPTLVYLAAVWILFVWVRRVYLYARYEL